MICFESIFHPYLCAFSVAMVVSLTTSLKPLGNATFDTVQPSWIGDLSEVFDCCLDEMLFSKLPAY